MVFPSPRTYSTATFRFLPGCCSFAGFAPEFNIRYQKNHAFSPEESTPAHSIQHILFLQN